MKRISGIVLLFLISLESCYIAPVPVFRLQSISDINETVWLHGKEYSKLVGENIELIIAFDEVRDNTITLDVEVINHGSKASVISSELFKGYFLDEKMVELSNNTHYMAIDPEDKLLQIDKALSKENARYSNESREKAVSSLFEFVSDVASIGEQKTDEEIEKESQEDIKREVQEINDDNNHSASITNLTNEKDKWKFSALRKTSLPANHSISGEIYFRLISESHYLKLVFDEEKENLSIIYKINKFSPN